MNRRRGWIVVAGALALAGCQEVTLPGEPGAEPAFRQGQVVQDRYIVLLDRSLPDPAAVAEELARNGGFAVARSYAAAVSGFSATIPAARLDAVQSDPRVLLVEPVEVYQLQVQETPTGVMRTGGDRQPTTSVNKDVAIIDSGIDEDHADLNVGGGVNFANGPANKFDDGNGHGTHVAGTVGAIDNDIGVVGTAPGATLWGVRVCGNSGFCFTDDMVAGIDWVAGQKASGAIDFASANMSISTADDTSPCSGSSDAVHQAICGLVNEGVVFAMAAGNDSRNKAAYPEVLAVSAAADFDGRGGGLGSPTCRSDEDETLANFSNYGSAVDIAAPGVCILSTWNDGGVNSISGTSMASPHVAGAVALYLEANGLAPAQDAAGVDAIEAAILGAALPQSDPCGFTNERGSNEPLLFLNATAFGGDGTCDDGSGGPVNQPPVASFDFACTDLACTFDGTGSSDPDGSIVSWSWNFGDGTNGSGATAGHSYGTGGTYAVTLTVTDDAGATDTDTQNVSVNAGGGGGFALTAGGYKVRGVQHADLSWSGSSASSFDVYRDGAVIATVGGSAYTDNIGNKGGGSYVYQVCEAGTATCSNEATVTF